MPMLLQIGLWLGLLYRPFKPKGPNTTFAVDRLECWCRAEESAGAALF